MQKNKIQRLQEVVKEQEDHMKDLKNECEEYECQTSLNDFLEHHAKGVTPKETKESFKKMSRHRSKPITLVESRNKLKCKGQRIR